MWQKLCSNDTSVAPITTTSLIICMIRFLWREDQASARRSLPRRELAALEVIKIYLTPDDKITFFFWERIIPF